MRPDVAAQRVTFHDRLEQACDGDYSKVVCTDEFGAATDMTPTYGRSVAGQRCVGRVPAGHWKSMTGILSVRLAGVAAATSIDAPTDCEVFLTYLTRVLLPACSPGDVLVLDNLPAHKARGVAEAVAMAGMRLLYLPPYSPDLHPIEMIISKVKRRLRELAARTIDTLHDAIAKALQTVTPADIAGCYRHCRYEQ